MHNHGYLPHNLCQGFDGTSVGGTGVGVGVSVGTGVGVLVVGGIIVGSGVTVGTGGVTVYEAVGVIFSSFAPNVGVTKSAAAAFRLARALILPYKKYTPVPEILSA